MNKLLAIIRKDTEIRFASFSEWLFFLILPIFFTFVLAGGTGTYNDPRTALTVVDQANSPLSAQLVTELKKSDSIRPVLKPLAEAEDEFEKRNVSALLVIPPDFDLAHLREGSLSLDLRQLPNNLGALAAYQTVESILQRLSSGVEIAGQSVAAAEQIRPFASAQERNAYFDAALSAAQSEIEAAPERVSITRAAVEDPVDYDPAANASAGQIITWVFIPLFGISGMFAYERATGTLRRLLTSPTRKATYLLGTLLGMVFWSLVQMLLLILFGTFVMKLNWGHSPAALAVILVSSALAASAIGVALGAFVKTESQASGLSIMLGMVMALLGGCWYPLELFPSVVQQAVKVLPTRWAMQGMLDIVLRGQGLSAVLPEAAVLLGFAALFYGIGIWRFRYE
ncbi:ABC-type multidrug transport system, permease component [Longilinea arvoryzae]|uniref:ABC-type multidrug transport system, permease component n=1 Tax=Longilinea arvoryzae TaxID=360412 RepID=A0A0S7BFW9_9CHLR|nr:ABC transporter permease [Longilinea arvoryzae]GAP13000.1 ABC-type multidrug transport system, permease component [Longilinea arvoryzae]